MPPFVHLTNPETYITGLWDFTRDGEARATWAERLRTHLVDTVRHAQEAEPPATAAHLERVARAWERVIEHLGDLSQPPPGRTVLEVVAIRDALFRGEPAPAPGTGLLGSSDVTTTGEGHRGSFDVFAAVKEASNAWALPRYAAAVAALESGRDENLDPREGEETGVAGPVRQRPEGALSSPGEARALDPARLERALVGMLAGNVLDVASAEVAEAARSGGSVLDEIAQRVRRKPPGIDGRARLISMLENVLRNRRHPRVLLFVDNAGMDFLLGVLPFARELATLGCRVVLAANERPALNDVTAAEANALVGRLTAGDDVLARSVDRGDLRIISTGNGTPGIDLNHVTEAVNAVDADLIVFEGQGRAVESTWNAELSRPCLRVATLKSPMVAARLGLEAFDTILEAREAGEGPSVTP